MLTHKNMLEKHGSATYALYQLISADARHWNTGSLFQEADNLMERGFGGNHEAFCMAAYLYAMLSTVMPAYPLRKVMEQIISEVGSFGPAEEQFDGMIIRGRAMWLDLHGVVL